MRANVTLAFNCQISVTADSRQKKLIHRPLRLFRVAGGDDRDRTDDLRLAKPALSQLSYIPGNRDAAAALNLMCAGGPG